MGQGYNLLEDRPSTGTCVNFVQIQDPSQSVQYKFDEVTSNTQVQSITNISASGSMKMAILKATARLSFLSDESFKTDTQKFLLSANVINSSLFAAPSADFKKGGEVVRPAGLQASQQIEYLTRSKISMKDETDALNVEKCGQGFVAAIVSGASLDAFLTMTKTNANSLAEIKGGLEADIGGIFTVSGNFQQKQTSAAIQQNTSVSVYKTGGTSTNIAYDLAGLKATVAAMPLEAATSPKPIRIAVLPYEYLDSMPAKKTYTAALYGQAVAAFFLAKDVFQRTANVIDKYERLSEEPRAQQPMYLKDISHYLELNARAMKRTNQLSTILQSCQEDVSEANRALWPSNSNGAAQTSGVSFVQAFGVTPSNEGQQRMGGFRPNGTPDTTDKEFAAFSAAVASKHEADAFRLDPHSTNVGDACNPNKNGAYLDLAVNDSIELATEEISTRPIFWSDLGPKYTEELKPLVEQIGGTDTVAEMTNRARPVLVEYNRLHRASRMLREVCGKSFSLPLCSINHQDFLERSDLSLAEGDLKFTQMKFEVQ